MRREDIFTAKELDVINTLLQRRINSEKEAINPSFLEKRSRMTRAGARKICENLAKLGLVATVAKRPLTKTAMTNHYYLSLSLDGFLPLMKRYFATYMAADGSSWSSSCLLLMGSDYLRAHLTSALVRKVLSDRGVKIRLFVNPENPDLERWEPKGYHTGDLDKYRILLLPVSADGKTPQQAAPITFGDELPDKEAMTQLIDRYYREVEENKVILPILTLLRISPTALDYFFGKWEAYKPEAYGSGSQGYDEIEHVLFHLIWNTIYDLSLSRNVPERGMPAQPTDVVIASIRPEHISTHKHEPPLLLVSLLGWQLIGYEAGYDTIHEYYGGEDGAPYEIERNPENGWVRIWVEKSDLEKIYAERRKPRDTKDSKS